MGEAHFSNRNIIEQNINFVQFGGGGNTKIEKIQRFRLLAALFCGQPFPVLINRLKVDLCCLPHKQRYWTTDMDLSVRFYSRTEFAAAGRIASLFPEFALAKSFSNTTVFPMIALSGTIPVGHSMTAALECTAFHGELPELQLLCICLHWSEICINDWNYASYVKVRETRYRSTAL